MTLKAGVTSLSVVDSEDPGISMMVILELGCEVTACPMLVPTRLVVSTRTELLSVTELAIVEG